MLLTVAGQLGWLAFVTFSETAGPVKSSGAEIFSFSMTAGQKGFWGQTVIYNTGDRAAVLKDVRPIDPRRAWRSSTSSWRARSGSCCR